MLRLLALILFFLALIPAPTTGRAQSGSAADSKDPTAILARPDKEVAKWALGRLAENKSASETLPEVWRSRLRETFDDFMAGAAQYTRLFVSSNRQKAAAVTYRRLEPGSGAPAEPAVAAHLVLLDGDGATLAEFDVIPYLEFDLLPDGSAVVGHGELMPRAMTDGVLHTSLSFYDGNGRLLRTIESMEFSPTHSVVLVPSSRALVLGVSGLLVAYDLDAPKEVWRRPLGNPSDTPRLSLSPDGRRVGALVLGDNGKTTLTLFDASGAEQGRYSFEGRTIPDTGWMFETGGRVLIVQDIVGNTTRLRILDAGNLKVLRTIREL